MSNKYTILLCGSEGTTYMEVEANAEQLAFLKHLRRLAMIGQNNYAPTIAIYEGGLKKTYVDNGLDKGSWFIDYETTGKEVA